MKTDSLDEPATTPGIGMEREMLGHMRRLLAGARVVRGKVDYILEKVEGKSVLDLGCVGHSLALSEQREDWLHAAISRRAKSCLGVDLLQAETAELRRRGWDILCGDITEMDLGRTFDVLVAADVIEHLTDFDGFFKTAARHMAPGGALLVSTPNPLGLSHFFYTGLRGMPFLNPDHTCWFDPKALAQLALRYGFFPEELAWVRGSWRPGEFLLNGVGGFGVYDFFTGRWSPTTKGRRWVRAGLQKIVFAGVNVLARAFLRRRYWSSDFVMCLRLAG